jgi:hypothetical protein
MHIPIPREYDVANGYGMPRAEAWVCGFLYDIKWDQIRETTVDKSDMMPKELKNLEDEKAMQDNAKEKEERQDKESATLQSEKSEEEFNATMEEKKKARKEAAEATIKFGL